MKVKKPHEPVMMTKKRFGYFPQAFIWHGKLYQVIATEESRTVSKRGPFNRVERLYFTVRCVEGRFELFQDVLNNTWHVEKFQSAREHTKAA